MANLLLLLWSSMLNAKDVGAVDMVGRNHQEYHLVCLAGNEAINAIRMYQSDWIIRKVFPHLSVFHLDFLISSSSGIIRRFLLPYKSCRSVLLSVKQDESCCSKLGTAAG